MVVYSQNSMRVIDQSLEELAESRLSHAFGRHFALPKVVFNYKEDCETNRTLYLVTDELLQLAAKVAKPDFKARKYEMHTYDYPKEGESTHSLFVRLPKRLTTSECHEQLRYFLDAFVEFGLLSETDCTVKIPPTSRQNDEHKGFAFLNFNVKVPVEVVAYVRLLTHDQPWELPQEEEETSEKSKTFHLQVRWSAPDVPNRRGKTTKTEVKPAKQDVRAGGVPGAAGGAPGAAGGAPTEPAVSTPAPASAA